jgi:hypothetical protein
MSRLLKVFVALIVASFIVSAAIMAGAIFNWPHALHEILVPLYLLICFPIALIVHWRLCNAESISKTHLLLYLLNPILAWTFFFFQHNANNKRATS